MSEQKKVPIARPSAELSANRDELQKKSREIAKNLWSGKLTVNEQAAINQICMLYGLDPILKQVVCLGGNMYITSGGLKVIGNKNKESAIDGIEVGPATPQERKDYGCWENDPKSENYQHLFKAIVWKRGCTRAFVEWGEADKNNVRLHNAEFKSMADMAKTRAVNRALRNAYDIALTSLEEMGYAANIPVTTEVIEEKKESIKKDQEKSIPKQEKKEEQKSDDYKGLLNLCVKAKKQIGDNAYYNILYKNFGIVHANQFKHLDDMNKFLEMCRDYWTEKNK